MPLLLEIYLSWPPSSRAFYELFKVSLPGMLYYVRQSHLYLAPTLAQKTSQVCCKPSSSSVRVKAHTTSVFVLDPKMFLLMGFHMPFILFCFYFHQEIFTFPRNMCLLRHLSIVTGKRKKSLTRYRGPYIGRFTSYYEYRSSAVANENKCWGCMALAYIKTQPILRCL